MTSAIPRILGNWLEGYARRLNENAKGISDDVPCTFYYGATQTTKLSSASPYLPVIFQQPNVGKSIPTNIAEPISLAEAFVASEALSGGAGASKLSPVTVRAGSGSSVQTYPSRHQNTFCV